MIIRDVAKACLQRRGIFSLTNIVNTTNLSRNQVRRALEKLEREGHITRVSETESPLPGFSKGRPNKEPRYTPRASLAKRVASTDDVRQKNTLWDAMWRAIRHMRRFTKRDIAIISGASLENVRYFTKRLRAAGYIKPYDGSTWALVTDPGPKRPCIKSTID
jgi:predicted ArsR family transcriptional regulator